MPVSETYGERRGWQWIERFPLGALARLSVVGELWDSDMTDHHSFWTFQRRPTAVAAHLYNCDEEKRETVRSWAAHHGLQASFPLDFPSWWYPGRTTLVEFMRAH